MQLANRTTSSTRRLTSKCLLERQFYVSSLLPTGSHDKTNELLTSPAGKEKPEKPSYSFFNPSICKGPFCLIQLPMLNPCTTCSQHPGCQQVMGPESRRHPSSPPHLHSPLCVVSLLPLDGCFVVVSYDPCISAFTYSLRNPAPTGSSWLLSHIRQPTEEHSPLLL